MLQKLKINNIALIKDLEVEFHSGLNILSGETGAGKSIIIDSIGFLLGDRADKTLIRNGEDSAKVEGLFYLENELNEKILSKYGIPYDEQLIISRTMSRENRSDIRINGNLITLSMLRDITSELVDICNQNENLYLLKTKNQLEILDSYCNNQELIKQYQNKIKDYNNILDKINSFGGSEEQRNKEIDFLQFQLNEIQDAKIKEDEEIQLYEDLKRLSNIEKIASSIQISVEFLENQPQGILALINDSIKELSYAKKYDKSLENLLERLSSTKIELEDIVYELNNYERTLDYNPEEFYALDSRMDTIKKLQRKYGSNTKEILNYQKEIEERLNNLINSKEEIILLENEKEKILDKIYSISLNLTKNRKENAQKLEKNVIEELKKLNMNKTQFKINFNNTVNRENLEKYLHQNGVDEIEFLFSANVGQDLQPLSKIISGGEMSRFMLAIKTVLADCDNIQTMIFDEIDTGISGKTLLEVSKKMAKISQKHQVLVVTHSFQIIAMADKNIFVSKKQLDNETVTYVKELNQDEKISLIAEMIGTDVVTKSAESQAIELLNWSKKIKGSN